MTDDTDARTQVLRNAERLRGRPFADVLTGLTSFNSAAGDPIDQGEVTTIALDMAGKPSSNGAGAELDDPRAELTTILALHTVGLRVTDAEQFGRGLKASVNLHVSDGTKILLDPIGSYASPAKLRSEIAASTGALPPAKGLDAARCLALIFKLAQHHRGAGKDAVAIEWGSDFLQLATVHELDMSDQADRWRAFAGLRNVDPAVRADADRTSYAAQCIVLKDRNGTRYVRCGWFLTYVRKAAGAYGSQELAQDMERVGWSRPGDGSGRIKATAPGHDEQLGWTFYTVPDGWENER